MKYKQFVYASLIVILATLTLAAASEQGNEGRSISRENLTPSSKLDRIISMWNKSSFASDSNSVHENFQEKYLNESYGNAPAEFFDNQVFAQNFPSELSKCIGDHQYQITENYTQGKSVILNCFKATLILSLVRYLGASPKSSIKLFDGLLELKKIPEERCGEGSDGGKKCKYSRYFERMASRSQMSQEKKNQYIRMYKKAMEKLVNEKTKIHLYKNLTEEEKAKQLSKINEGSQAFLSEILRNLGDEHAEKVEEEKLKKEIADPRLLSVLDAFSRNYMLKLKFYPGVSARMMRSHNGGVTFDLEMSEAPEEEGEEGEASEGSTREIKYSKSQAKDFDGSDEEGVGNKKRKKGKKKKKEIKKKAKKLKKIIPYLLLPMLIQVTLLPFVFKKLFFLAMKALFAGKVALILIGFNLLRNTCIKNEDSYAQKIRVEHYGYNKGEEYGAWVNGRSVQEPRLMSALSQEPYLGQKPGAAS